MDARLYIKYIINRDLLKSSGNHTQYFVITSNWKESEKEYINSLDSLILMIIYNHKMYNLQISSLYHKYKNIYHKFKNLYNRNLDNKHDINLYNTYYVNSYDSYDSLCCTPEANAAV